MCADKIADNGLTEFSYLIIDPHGDQRRTIISSLERYGLSTYFEAGDAVVGLHVLLEQDIRAILVRENMLTISGLEFVRFVRGGKGHAIDPETPIVVLGETRSSELPARIRDAGAHSYLATPVDPEELYQTVRRAVLEPGSFVRSPHYSGPDRRRTDLGPPGGVERRQSG